MEHRPALGVYALRGTRSGKIFLQLLGEFWLTLLLGAVWTAFNVIERPGKDWTQKRARQELQHEANQEIGKDAEYVDVLPG